MKKCEICGIKLPDDYGNNLCDTHYVALVNEIELNRQRDLATVRSNPDSAINPNAVEEVAPVTASESPKIDPGEEKPEETDKECTHENCGILDPNYKENPEADDKDQVLANIAQFVYSGKMLWYPTRNMYNAVKNWCMKRVMAHSQYPKYIWKPKIVDVGCGSGVGSNVLSQEADFVWGIDKNDMSIRFAKETMERAKNGIYYSAQLTFDQIDIVNDNREFMQFDVVVAIEIIEHVKNVDKFLRAIIRFAKKRRGEVIKQDPTVFFISTPNRNNPKIKKDKPQNLFHVREWTAEEFQKLMEKYFEKVELLNQKGEPLTDMADTPILAKCEIPRV